MVQTPEKYFRVAGIKDNRKINLLIGPLDGIGDIPHNVV